MCGAAQEGFDRDVEVDGFAVSVYPVDVAKVAGGSASGGDDGVVEFGGGEEKFVLQLAEGLFAIAFKEDGDGGVELGFEELVKVKPLEAEFERKFVAYGGFAAVHVAYEVDVHREERERGGRLFLVAAGRGEEGLVRVSEKRGRV